MTKAIRLVGCSYFAVCSVLGCSSPSGTQADAVDRGKTIESSAPGLHDLHAGPVNLPDSGAAVLSQFSLDLRRAVAKGDIDWLLSRMAKEGWTIGDVHLEAAEYASEFRRGNLDYALVFGDWSKQGQPSSPATLAYRDWFMRCPSGRASLEWDDPRPEGGSAYVLRWTGASCPNPGPTIRVTVRDGDVTIRGFRD